MFIEIDIVDSENMIFNFNDEKFIINNCKISILFVCILFKSRMNRNINIFVVIMLLAFAITPISFKFKNNFKLFRNRDFSFQFHIIFIVDLNVESEIMMHVMNANILMMHVYNIIDKTMRLSKHIKLNKIIDFEKKNCYHLNSAYAYLTIEMN